MIEMKVAFKAVYEEGKLYSLEEFSFLNHFRENPQGGYKVAYMGDFLETEDPELFQFRGFEDTPEFREAYFTPWWLTKPHKLWEMAPELEHGEGLAILLPAQTSWREVEEEVFEDGKERAVLIFTTPLGGVVEKEVYYMGAEYMCPHVVYLRILRDAPDIVRL